MAKDVSPRLCRSVGQASDLLKRLANPNRLAILCFLMEEPQTVSAMEGALGIRQPTLSQQLNELRQGGMIEGQKIGRSIRYRVTDARAQMLVQALRLIYGDLGDVTGRHRPPGTLSGALDDMMFDG